MHFISTLISSPFLFRACSFGPKQKTIYVAQSVERVNASEICALLLLDLDIICSRQNKKICVF